MVTYSEASARRWSLLVPLSRLGIGLISFFALGKESSGGGGGGTGSENTASASATKASLLSLCKIRGCGLANGPPWCEHPSGKPWEYKCPSGSHQAVWTTPDPETNRDVVCGECTSAKGEDCYRGPWPCSIWYFSDQQPPYPSNTDKCR